MLPALLPGQAGEEDITAVEVTAPPAQRGCTRNGDWFANGADIVTADPCEHCYCLNGDVVCAVQECMGPLEGGTDNCVALPAPPGQTTLSLTAPSLLRLRPLRPLRPLAGTDYPHWYRA